MAQPVILEAAMLHKFPKIVPNEDFILTYDEENGYAISYWGYNQPKPTIEELIAIWDEIKDTYRPEPSGEEVAQEQMARMEFSLMEQQFLLEEAYKENANLSFLLMNHESDMDKMDADLSSLVFQLIGKGVI
ncbi:MAG: XkdW family protein [Bacillus sp. (in: firmicutes)]